MILSAMEQQFSNDLTRNASPDKPIINLEAPFFVTPRYADRLFGVKEYTGPAGPNAIRTFFWHQLVYGASGSVISYLYTNGRSDGGPSVWDPKLMTRSAVREIPLVKAEISDLSEIVLRRPRIRGRLGLLYSYETAQENRPWFRRDFIDVYASAVLTRVPVDIVNRKAKKFPALTLDHCIRFPRRAFECLEDYAMQSGTVILTFDCLRYDEKVRPLDLGSLAGISIKRTLGTSRRKEPTADLTEIGVGKRQSSYSRMSSARGYIVEPEDAKPIGASDFGPPITVRRAGKGQIYYIPWNFPPETLRYILRWISNRRGLRPDVDVRLEDGISVDYIETHLLGRKGRYAVYALNFGGGPRKGRLVVWLPEGSFFVRNVRTQAYISPDRSQSKHKWTTAELKNGIPTSLPYLDPVLFIVESSNLHPSQLKGLSEEQKEVLSWAWRPSPPSRWRIPIDGYHTAEFRVFKSKMPTAVKALEDDNWEVNSLISRLGDEVETFSSKGITREKLSSYQVLVLCGTAHWQRV